LPEHRLNPEFVHFVDEHYKVMTENFTKRFVEQSGIGLAPERVAKLALQFQHAERGFDIGTVVVVLQILFPLEHEVVVHLLEQGRSFAGCVALEGDERSPIAKSFLCGREAKRKSWLLCMRLNHLWPGAAIP
jgi:hypothetical protein